jgi:hypothetical protein
MAKRNARDLAVPLIEETSKLIPEISGTTEEGAKLPGVGAVRTIEGINYSTLVRVTNPSVSFRDANEGTASSVSQYINRLVETYILNPRWESDKAVADRSEDGPDAYISDEAFAIMEATMQLLGVQFFYGRKVKTTAGDVKGFPGLIDAYSTAYEVDATGTPGSATSVWAVKFGPGHVQWVYGKNGTLVVPDKRVETIYRNSLPLDGYVQSMLAYPGVQVGSTRSCGRIKNITTANGKGMTDALGFKLLSLMPVRPDCWFMSKVVREQLRSSRTATNATGAAAPIPTEIGGIPIAVTDSLSFSE